MKNKVINFVYNKILVSRKKPDKYILYLEMLQKKLNDIPYNYHFHSKEFWLSHIEDVKNLYRKGTFNNIEDILETLRFNLERDSYYIQEPSKIHYNIYS